MSTQILACLNYSEVFVCQQILCEGNDAVLVLVWKGK